ncbi:MAG TPA: hypothetical protein VG895_03060 [Patescibacteria group bacterium]|nr:hypothetical protein [Patescibacteria group bacterium]
MRNIKKNIIVLFLIVLSLTPVIWFVGRPGILVDGVDTNFPLQPALWFARRFFAWTNITNAGSDFSAGSAGTLFHFLQFVPFKLGFSLQTVELFSFIFWFTLIIFSSWFLARLVFPKKNIPQMIFVILYSFNIYLFNSWENVKVSNLSLISAIPIGLSTLILLRQKKIKREISFLLFLVTGIILMGAGINPAYIICFFVVLGIYVFSQIILDFKNKDEVLQDILNFVLFGFIVALVNASWILPTVHFIFSSITASNSIGSIGFSNWVDSLSQNTSLINVFRMMGAWDWYSFDGITKAPLYIPYATRYFFNPLFVGFSFFIPSLSLIAFIFRKRINNVFYISFALMLVIGLFLTAGTHPPTGVLFAFLGNHLPFFSLFRSPWYIFAPLVALPIAGLVSALFFNLGELIKNKRVVNSFGLFVIIGFLIYSYPLVLGKIFRPDFNGTFYLKFPDYVFEAETFLNNNPSRGRILSYADDNIEKFSWGYSGVDSILNLMTDREVVDAPLNDTTSPISQIITQTYESLKRNEIDKASNLMNVMNIGQIFVKNDQVTLMPKISNQIANNLERTFGQWNFYNFPKNNPTPEIYSADCCNLSYPYNDSALNLGILNNKILVNPKDSLFAQEDFSNFTSTTIHTKNLQLSNYLLSVSGQGNFKENLEFRDLSKAEYDFDVPSAGMYSPILQRYGLDYFGVISGNKMTVNLDGKNEIWTVAKSDDSYVYFMPIDILQGGHKATISIDVKNMVNLQNFNYVGKADFNLENNIFTIFNKNKNDAMVNFLINNFDPYSFYVINVSYRQIYGNKAQVLLSQKQNNTPLKNGAEVMPDYPDWQDYSFYYQPIETNSTLNLSLVSPQTEDVLGTKVEYQNLSVQKIFANDLFFESSASMSFSQPIVKFSKNSPVFYSGEVTNVNGPYVIVFGENYSPDWQINIEGENNEVFHFTANYYENAWFVNSKKGNYKFTIYYKPQSLLNIGYLIAGVSAFFVFAYFIYEKIKR